MHRRARATHELTDSKQFIECRGDGSMKTTKLAIVLMGVMAMLGGTAASADSTADQNTVAALDTEYQLAVKNNDADTMARILSDDFVLILGTGQTYTKA